MFDLQKAVEYIIYNKAVLHIKLSTIFYAIISLLIKGKIMKKIALFVVISSFVLADKMIEIDLSNQKLIAKENGKSIITSSISSGRVGYTTPRGKFKILEKDRMHISNRYPIVDKEAGIRGGAKMPYMLRVTNTGVAIHAGEMVNYPDSHGCIRIPYGKAMQLFKWTDVGTKVSIVGKTPYGDSINQMRLSLLKNQKEEKKHKRKRDSNDVGWVDEHLSYYDNL